MKNIAYLLIFLSGLFMVSCAEDFEDGPARGTNPPTITVISPETDAVVLAGTTINLKANIAVPSGIRSAHIEFFGRTIELPTDGNKIEVDQNLLIPSNTPTGEFTYKLVVTDMLRNSVTKEGKLQVNFGVAAKIMSPSAVYKTNDFTPLANMPLDFKIYSESEITNIVLKGFGSETQIPLTGISQADELTWLLQSEFAIPLVDDGEYPIVIEFSNSNGDKYAYEVDLFISSQKLYAIGEAVGGWGDEDLVRLDFVNEEDRYRWVSEMTLEAGEIKFRPFNDSWDNAVGLTNFQIDNGDGTPNFNIAEAGEYRIEVVYLKAGNEYPVDNGYMLVSFTNLATGKKDQYSKSMHLIGEASGGWNDDDVVPMTFTGDASELKWEYTMDMVASEFKFRPYANSWDDAIGLEAGALTIEAAKPNFAIPTPGNYHIEVVFDAVNFDYPNENGYTSITITNTETQEVLSYPQEFEAPDNLYLIGSPNGWTNTAVNLANWGMNKNGAVFSARFDLAENSEFKFVPNPPSWAGEFGYGYFENVSSFIEESGGNLKLTGPTREYLLVLDLFERSVNMYKSGLFKVGSANGWNNPDDAVQEFEETGDKVYSLTIELVEDEEFKMVDALGSWNYGEFGFNDFTLSGTANVIESGGNFKYEGEGGSYTIVVNLNTNTITIN